MLLVHLPLRPAEAVEQLEGAHGRLPRLQVVEDALDAEGDRLEVVDVRRHVVHGQAEGADEEQGLQQRVQVAGRPLVHHAVVSALDCLVTLGDTQTSFFAAIFLYLGGLIIEIDLRLDQELEDQRVRVVQLLLQIILYCEKLANDEVWLVIGEGGILLPSLI